MSDRTTLTYTCQTCGYENHWTRDEILQRGRKVVYRGEEREVIYSLRCKNPGPPRCNARRRVAISVEEE